MGKLKRPVVRRGIVSSSVSGWKYVSDKGGDSDCQWLLYNPRGLRDGDEVTITFRLKQRAAALRGESQP